MKKKAKLLVAGILAFAAIGSTGTVIRMGYLHTIVEGPDFLYATTDVALWSTVEPGIGITAGSIATFRPLVRHLMWHLGFANEPREGRTPRYYPSNSERKRKNRRGHRRSLSPSDLVPTDIEGMPSHIVGPDEIDLEANVSPSKIVVTDMEERVRAASTRLHMSTQQSHTTPSTSNKDALTKTAQLNNAERFLRLLQYSKALVAQNGPYTTAPGTAVLLRASQLRVHRDDEALSTAEFALSLAAAQGSISSAQPDGPEKDDLLLFNRFWETAVAVLEEILSPGSLPQESFGWGIFGLSSGYMHPPSNELTMQNTFSSYKYRLHAALLKLPSLTGAKGSEYAVREKTSTAALVKVRREIHTCAHILLHKFRQEEWKRVRWFHVVAVAERWLGAFGQLPPQRVVKDREKCGKEAAMFDDEGLSELEDVISIRSRAQYTARNPKDAGLQRIERQVSKEPPEPTNQFFVPAEIHRIIVVRSYPWFYQARIDAPLIISYPETLTDLHLEHVQIQDLICWSFGGPESDMFALLLLEEEGLGKAVADYLVH
ncbi:integral membrane protein [Stemphylium lycopersici]|nr:integral membrane protein [Stemphylium lycopersici]